MAQFDLKNAIIYARDGYGLTGTVTTAAALGAVSVPISGLTGALAVGDTFTIAGDDTVYVVTAVTPAPPATTTSVTIAAPGLVAAAAADAVVTIGPHQIEVKLGTGNCSYTEKKNRDYTLDRGKLSTVRDGDEAPVEVRLDAIWEFLTGTTDEPPTLEDVMKKRGAAANWVTTSSDPCEPYCIDLVIEYKPPCGGIDWERITLPDFRYEEAAHDMKAGTLSFNGKCNVTEASVVRVEAA